MENYKVKISSHDEGHEYTLIRKRTKDNDISYKLKHSKNSIWTELARNKKILKIIDDGNGVSVKFKEGLEFYLDYAQLVELGLAIQGIHADQNRLLSCDYKHSSKKEIQ